MSSEMGEKEQKSLMEIIGVHLASLITETDEAGFRDYRFQGGKDSDNIITLENGRQYKFYLNLTVLPVEQPKIKI